MNNFHFNRQNLVTFVKNMKKIKTITTGSEEIEKFTELISTAIKDIGSQNKEKYTKIFIPKPIVNWFGIVKFDWKLFGVRINDNIDQFSFNEDGFLELEIPTKKLEYWKIQINESFIQYGFFINNYPKNIDFGKKIWNVLNKNNLPTENKMLIIEVEESDHYRTTATFEKSEDHGIVGTFWMQNKTGIHIYNNGECIVRRFLYIKDIPK